MDTKEERWTESDFSTILEFDLGLGEIGEEDERNWGDDSDVDAEGDWQGWGGRQMNEMRFEMDILNSRFGELLVGCYEDFEFWN